MSARGFTLIEVLVALFIVAVGLTATLRATGMGTNATGNVRVKQLGQWLIQNRAAERVAMRDWPGPGETSHEEELAGQRFILREKVLTTPNPNFRRLEISAAPVEQPDYQAHRSVLFLIAP